MARVDGFVHPYGVPVQQLRKLTLAMARVAAVKRHREQAEGKLSRALADTPTRYHVTVIPERPFLALPEVSCGASSIYTNRMDRATCHPQQ